MRVVFSQTLVAPVQGTSPSAAKPAAVMAAWAETWPNLEMAPAQPVTFDDLYRAHSPATVDDVLALRDPNGFGTRSAELNASLRYTGGAMLAAARWALAGGYQKPLGKVVAIHENTIRACVAAHAAEPAG